MLDLWEKQSASPTAVRLQQPALPFPWKLLASSRIRAPASLPRSIAANKRTCVPGLPLLPLRDLEGAGTPGTWPVPLLPVPTWCCSGSAPWLTSSTINDRTPARVCTLPPQATLPPTVQVSLRRTQGQPRCCRQTEVENAGDTHPATPKLELNAFVSPPARCSWAPAPKWALRAKGRGINADAAHQEGKPELLVFYSFPYLSGRASRWGKGARASPQKFSEHCWAATTNFRVY